MLDLQGCWLASRRVPTLSVERLVKGVPVVKIARVFSCNESQVIGTQWFLVLGG